MKSITSQKIRVEYSCYEKCQLQVNGSVGWNWELVLVKCPVLLTQMHGGKSNTSVRDDILEDKLPGF